MIIPGRNWSICFAVMKKYSDDCIRFILFFFLFHVHIHTPDGQMEMGSLTCVEVWMRAVHMKGHTSLHTSLFGETE